jgi:cytochrome c-type biogenesis protein CcmE
MKPRHKRTAIIAGGLAALGIAAYLVLNAFQSNLVFFFSPTQVFAGEAPKNRTFRIGGLVKEGTVKRDNLTVAFVVTDTAKEVPVTYTGILPDLFKEGKGVVAQGKLDAKHDENYMPPEAKAALDQAALQKTMQSLK